MKMRAAERLYERWNLPPSGVERCQLYNVEFFKFNRKTLEYPKTGGRDGIYADQLIDIFEGETGLFLKL